MKLLDKGRNGVGKVIAVELAALLMVSMCACGSVHGAEKQETMGLQSIGEELAAALRPSEEQQPETEQNEDAAQTPQVETEQDIAPTAAATPEEEAAAAPEEEAAAAETPEEAPEEAEPAADGIRPEFQEAMDSYEEFYNQYCALLEKYQENPTDLSLLLEYNAMLAQAQEMDEKFDAWDDSDMNAEEAKYYLEVNTRIQQKLIDLAE